MTIKDLLISSIYNRFFKNEELTNVFSSLYKIQYRYYGGDKRHKLTFKELK